MRSSHCGTTAAGSCWGVVSVATSVPHPRVDEGVQDVDDQRHHHDEERAEQRDRAAVQPVAQAAPLDVEAPVTGRGGAAPSGGPRRRGALPGAPGMHQALWLLAERLRSEQDGVLDGGPPGLDVLMGSLPELDMAVDETLRLYPPLSHLDRDATQPERMRSRVGGAVWRLSLRSTGDHEGLPFIVVDKRRAPKHLSEIWDLFTELATSAGWRLVTQRPDPIQPVYILELA